MNSTNYIEFESLSENSSEALSVTRNKLKEFFISDLDNYSNKDVVSQNLKSILTEAKYKGKIRINFLSKRINREICYLIIISGNNDFVTFSGTVAFWVRFLSGLADIFIFRFDASNCAKAEKEKQIKTNRKIQFFIPNINYVNVFKKKLPTINY